jgi:type II secretory pathway pseudopilin PulG
MRTSALKVMRVGVAAILLCASGAYAASRIDCLEKLGNNATKEQLDSCVSGKLTPVSGGSQQSSVDTNSEEATCVDMGFKKKTEGYGKCVLELLDRKENAVASNDPDDATCTKYGFKRKTDEYAKCRQQIDSARAQARQQQAQFAAQQAQYKQRLEAYQDAQERQAWLGVMRIGLAMMGQNAGGGGGYYGPAPVAPVAPGPRTYVLPNNQVMTCNTTGNITNCM